MMTRHTRAFVGRGRNMREVFACADCRRVLAACGTTDAAGQDVVTPACAFGAVGGPFGDVFRPGMQCRVLIEVYARLNVVHLIAQHPNNTDGFGGAAVLCCSEDKWVRKEEVQADAQQTERHQAGHGRRGLRGVA